MAINGDQRDMPDQDHHREKLDQERGRPQLSWASKIRDQYYTDSSYE
jgi:hypothetical protein